MQAAFRAFMTCDSERRFFDVYFGASGSTNDPTMMPETFMYKNRDTWAPSPYFYATDGGLPIRPWLMTPFGDRDSLRDICREFNRRFCGMRARVEQGFGILKARWQILTKPWTMGSKDDYTWAFYFYVVMHNWCITQRLELSQKDRQLAAS